MVPISTQKLAHCATYERDGNQRVLEGSGDITPEGTPCKRWQTTRSDFMSLMSLKTMMTSDLALAPTRFPQC